jgi:hypothetical protein
MSMRHPFRNATVVDGSVPRRFWRLLYFVIAEILVLVPLWALTAHAQMSDYEWHHPTTKVATKDVCVGKLEQGENTDWLEVGDCYSGGDKEITTQMLSLCRMGQACRLAAWISPHNKIRKIISKLPADGWPQVQCRGPVKSINDSEFGPGISVPGEPSNCDFGVTTEAGREVLAKCKIGDVCEFEAVTEDDGEGIILGGLGPTVRRVK